MKRLYAATALALVMCGNKQDPNTAVVGSKGEVFTSRVVVNKLSDPWEVTYGPDSALWVTEAKGYRVSRINPSTGAKHVLLNLNSAKNFTRYDAEGGWGGSGKRWPQGGLMGLALHPQLLSGKPYVYVAYLYSFKGANARGNGCAENFGGCFFSTKIVRYTYEPRADTLINPEVLCDTIPGSSDHNSGRLMIAPVDGKDYLFYTVGDMGAGQFDNANRPNHAQQVTFYEGKVLRFNTVPDNDSNELDKWIPNDNPFNTSTQSAVWSYGHRNAQGLAYAMLAGAAKIYSSEHGPFSDDEINIIEKGKNYGHPLVIGYADGNYDGLAAGATSHRQVPGTWHTSYPDIVNERANAKAMGADYRNPIMSLFATPNNILRNVLNETRSGGYANWPSVAPSSIDVYTSSAIPGWKNSLLVPTLKGGDLIRLQLNESGDGIVGDTMSYFKAHVRYRDIAISPDGKKIYLAIDSSQYSSGPTEGRGIVSNCGGCIVEYTYVGKGDSAVDDKKRQ